MSECLEVVRYDFCVEIEALNLNEDIILLTFVLNEYIEKFIFWDEMFNCLRKNKTNILFKFVK